MPQLDLNSIIQQMVGAVSGSLKNQWPQIKDAATTALKNLAQTLVDIEQMKLDGTITDEKAALMIDMQKNAIKMVLLTEEGLGLLAAEAAINAAIGVVKDVVFKAIGIAI